MRKISFLLLAALLANSIPVDAHPEPFDSTVRPEPSRRTLRVEQPEQPASQAALSRQLNASSGGSTELTTGLEEVRPLWATDVGQNRIWQMHLLPGAQRRIAAITTPFLLMGDMREGIPPKLDAISFRSAGEFSENYRSMAVGRVTDSKHQFLAIGTTSGRVVAYDLSSEDLSVVILGDRVRFQTSGSVAVDPSGKIAFITGARSEVHAWNMETKTSVPSHPMSSFFQQDSNSEAGFVQSSDKRFTALTGKNQIQVWDSQDQTGWRWQPPKTGNLSVSRISLSGKLIAVAQNNVVYLFSADNRDSVRTLSEVRFGKEITSLAFSPDSEYLIAGDKRGILHVWNIASSRVTETIAQVQAHEKQISSLSFYVDILDRTVLVSAGHDGKIKSWDLAALVSSAGLEENDEVDQLIHQFVNGKLTNDRRDAARALSVMGDKAAAAIPALRAALTPGTSDISAVVRKAAAIALGKLAIFDEETVRVLFKASVLDEFFSVRVSAHPALMHVGVKNPDQTVAIGRILVEESGNNEDFSHRQQDLEIEMERHSHARQRKQPSEPLGEPYVFKAGEILQFSHGQTGQPIKVVYKGHVETPPGTDIHLPVFRAETPNGWVAVSGNALAMAQREAGDWRKSSPLIEAMLPHRNAKTAQVGTVLRVLNTESPFFGIENRMFIIPLDVLREMIANPNVVVSSEVNLRPGQIRFEDQQGFSLMIRFSPFDGNAIPAEIFNSGEFEQSYLLGQPLAAADAPVSASSWKSERVPMIKYQAVQLINDKTNEPLKIKLVGVVRQRDTRKDFFFPEIFVSAPKGQVVLSGYELLRSQSQGDWRLTARARLAAHQVALEGGTVESTLRIHNQRNGEEIENFLFVVSADQLQQMIDNPQLVVIDPGDSLLDGENRFEDQPFDLKIKADPIVSTGNFVVELFNPKQLFRRPLFEDPKPADPAPPIVETPPLSTLVSAPPVMVSLSNHVSDQPAPQLSQTVPASPLPVTAPAKKSRREELEEQAERDSANEGVLERSGSAREVASVLLSDRRFQSLLVQDEQHQTGPFLQSVRKDEPDLHLAQGLQSRLQHMDRAREGNNPKLFFDGLTRLVQMVFDESAKRKKGADSKPQSSGLEENDDAAWADLQQKISDKASIKVRIGDVLPGGDRVAVRYLHDGKELPGAIPFSVMENVLPPYLADLFLLQRGQEIDVLPKQITTDDLNGKQFTAFVGIAPFDFLAQRLQAIREIQWAADRGAEIEMELLGVVNQERGVIAFKYQSSVGPVVFKTYLSRFFQTGVTENHPVYIVKSWAAYHTGKNTIVKITPTEFQKGGGYPLVYFNVNLPKAQLDQEISHGRDELRRKFERGEPADFRVEWFSHNSVRVFYIGEQGWVRTIVPMRLLFDGPELSLDDTQESVLRSIGDLWRGVPLVSNMNREDSAVYPIVGDPKFSVRRVLDQVEPALQELREMAVRPVPPEITVIARSANFNGLAVLYEGKNGSWKRGFVDIREVKPTGASTEQRQQWIEQAVGRKIHVTLRTIKTPESSTRVYFSWADPERDLLGNANRAVAETSGDDFGAGLEETLPPELERATFSGERVPVRVLDLASDKPFFNAVYTAPDGQQARGFVPIPRLFQDALDSRFQMRVNQKLDRLMANGEEPILAQVDLQSGELHFYPDLHLNALDHALNRLLDDLEGMVGSFPAVDLPAQVTKRVPRGNGAEVLYRLEDGSGRRGRGYLTLAPEQSGWLQEKIGHEIRVTPIGVDRTRSEKQVIFRPAELSSARNSLLEQKLLEKSVTLDQILTFLDEQSARNKELPLRLIQIYMYSYTRVWKNMTRLARLAVLRWLASRGDSADADLAGRLFPLFNRAWKDPYYGRSSQAWALRGMAVAARDDAQREAARQNIEAWFQRTPFPEPEHTAVLDPVVYELFGWSGDAYSLSLDVRSRSTTDAGQEENAARDAVYAGLREKIQQQQPIQVFLIRMFDNGAAAMISYKENGISVKGSIPIRRMFNDDVPYLAKIEWVRLHLGKMIDVIPTELSLKYSYPLTVRPVEQTEDLVRERTRVIEELTRKQRKGEPILVTVEGYADQHQFLILTRYASETGSVLLTLPKKYIRDSSGRHYSTAVIKGWVRFHEKKRDFITVQFSLGQSAARPLSQLDATLTLSEELLQGEMESGEREMRAIQEQQPLITVYREGVTAQNAKVSFIGETGWLPGVVPLGQVFSPQNLLRADTAFLWLIHEAKNQMSIRVNDWTRYDGRPVFVARMDIPADRFVEKQAAAVADIQRGLGEPTRLFSVTVEDIASDGRGMLIRYRRPLDGSWIAGYVPRHFVGPATASETDRSRWLEQAAGRTIHVAVYELEPDGSDHRVIFGWDNPEADLQQAGLEEAPKEKLPVRVDHELWIQFLKQDSSVRQAAADELVRRGVIEAFPELFWAFASIEKGDNLAEATAALRTIISNDRANAVNQLISALGNRYPGNVMQVRGAALAVAALGPDLPERDRVVSALKNLLSPQALRDYWISFRQNPPSREPVRQSDTSAMVLTWGAQVLPAAAVALAKLDPSGRTIEDALTDYEKPRSGFNPEWIIRMADREIRPKINGALKQQGQPPAVQPARVGSGPLASMIRRKRPGSGLEEATATIDRRESRISRKNEVFFLDAALLDPAITAGPDFDLTLAGLTIDLKRVTRWDEQTTGDLQIVLVSDENRPNLIDLYSRFQVVEIKREAGSDPRFLPLQAIPEVILDALDSGKRQIDLDVTPYLHLQEYSLQDIWQILTDQFV